MSFRANRFTVLRKVVDPTVLKYIQIMCDMTERNCLIEKPPTETNPYPFGDEQIPQSFSNYSSCFGDSLITLLKEKFAYVAGTNLHETYSYWRAYYKGAVLTPHKDRESCEFTASICIKKDETKWPIYIKAFDQSIHEVELEEGDAVFFQGGMLEHWRNAYEGICQKQIFLHYVSANGKYKHFKYDGRPNLGFSKYAG